MPALEIEDSSKQGIKAKAFSRADGVFTSFSVVDALIMFLILLKIYAASNWVGSEPLANALLVDGPPNVPEKLLLFACFSVDLYLALRIIEELRRGADMQVINQYACYNTASNLITVLIWAVVKLLNHQNALISFVIFFIRILKLMPVVRFLRGTTNVVTDDNWDHMEEFGKSTTASGHYVLENQGLGSEEEDNANSVAWSTTFGMVALCLFGIALISHLTASSPHASTTPMPQATPLSIPTTATGRRLYPNCDDGQDADPVGAFICGAFWGCAEGAILAGLIAFLGAQSKWQDAGPISVALFVLCTVGGVMAALSTNCRDKVMGNAIAGGFVGAGLAVAIVA